MFDSSIPKTKTRVRAQELRDNFNALKALIDAQATQMAAFLAQLAALTTTVTTMQSALAGLQAQLALVANLVPVGAIIPWFKDMPGAAPLPGNFVECNGQILDDPESNLHGQFIPDINNGVQRFVRGGLSSGVTGGSDTFATASADNAGVGVPQNFVTVDFSPGASPIPPFVTAVYIMRVK